MAAALSNPQKRYLRGLAHELQPILLGGPGPGSGSFEHRQTIRLLSFPRTDRMRLEFFAASRDNPPLSLGVAEAAVEP